MDFGDYAIKLTPGSHANPKEGLCVMECVAYIMGEMHSDTPKCADRDVSALAIMLNDNAPTGRDRQRLLKLVLRLAGSKAWFDDRERIGADSKAILGMMLADQKARMIRAKGDVAKAHGYPPRFKALYPPLPPTLHENSNLASAYVNVVSELELAEQRMRLEWEMGYNMLDTVLPPLEVLEPVQGEKIDTKARELERITA